jgi:hypothetical protein
MSTALDARAELNVGVRAALAHATAEHASEEIYGYSLALHPLGGFVSLAVGTERQLASAVERYKAKWSSSDGDLDGLLRRRLRWNCDDGWHYLKHEFDRANLQLAALIKAKPEAGQRLAHGTCVVALQELDWDGAFGDRGARDTVVVNIYYGDQRDEDLVTWAKQLNPFPVAQRFETELRAGREARSKLRSPGRHQ